MPKKPSKSPEKTQSETDFITNDPARFNMQRVYDLLLKIMQNIRGGIPVNGDEVCRCSMFPLEDLAHSALKGELFPDEPTSNLEGLARRLAFHLWGEVVRINTAQLLSDRRSDD